MKYRPVVIAAIPEDALLDELLELDEFELDEDDELDEELELDDELELDEELEVDDELEVDEELELDEELDDELLELEDESPPELPPQATKTALSRAIRYPHEIRYKKLRNGRIVSVVELTVW